jgi:hypothetical protein
MTRFIVFTPFTRPGLHIWREGTQLKLYLEPLQQPGLPAGFHAFDCELGVAPQEKIYSLLFQWNHNGTDQIEWEHESHIHEVPRLENNRLPPSVWLFHGSARAVVADPLARQQDRARIHLLTAARYMHAELLVWNAPGLAQETIPLTAHDESGPFWDLDLSGRSQSFFQFKFRRPVEGSWKDEHDFAHRLWVSQDGAEVWTEPSRRCVPRVVELHLAGVRRRKRRRTHQRRPHCTPAPRKLAPDPGLRRGDSRADVEMPGFFSRSAKRSNQHVVV